MEGSYPAERCINVIEKCLNKYGLSWERDIVGCTTDGASVMVKLE
jgi:hypothetical protein